VRPPSTRVGRDPGQAVVPDPVELLHAKVRSYTFFVLDGQLWKRFPEFQDHVVGIRLEAVEFPVPAIHGALEEVASDLSLRDIPFRAYWGDPPREICLGPEVPPPHRLL